jgi:hypothetical protein
MEAIINANHNCSYSQRALSAHGGAICCASKRAGEIERKLCAAGRCRTVNTRRRCDGRVSSTVTRARASHKQENNCVTLSIYYSQTIDTHLARHPVPRMHVRTQLFLHHHMTHAHIYVYAPNNGPCATATNQQTGYKRELIFRRTRELHAIKSACAVRVSAALVRL